MIVFDTGPVDWRIPLVDGQGRPSPEFQRKWDIQRQNNNSIVTPVGYVYGLEMSAAGSSAILNVKLGAAADSTGNSMMRLTSNFTKTTGAFVAGTGNGCLNTGTIAVSTWYHVFLIAQVNAESPDIMCATSLAPTLPTGYVMSRRIGSIFTDGSGNWIKFVQISRNVLLDATVMNASGATPPTTPTLQSVSTPPGVATLANLRIAANNGGVSLNEILFTSPNITGNTANVPGANAQMFVPAGSAGVGQEIQIWTNTSSQVMVSAINNLGGYFLMTYGWFDPL